MYQVYSLQSIPYPNRFYIGSSINAEFRLHYHNSGRCPHTAKFRPWKCVVKIAFAEKSKAVAFEKYLKSHSGRAFANKHF